MCLALVCVLTGRQRGARLHDDQYQTAMSNAIRMWNPEAAEHAKTLTFEDDEVIQRMINGFQCNEDATPEQKREECADLEERYGKKSVQQAQRQHAFLKLAFDKER